MARRARRLGPGARWTLRVIAIVVAVWIAASGFMLWQVRAKTTDGLDRLERARDEQGEGRAALAAAGRDFADAHDLADGPVLSPWEYVPLFGQNVRSAESLTRAAERVARVGERAARDAGRLLEQEPGNGFQRLDLLDALGDVAARARRGLEQMSLGPDFFLVAPLGDARERFLERLGRLREAVADAPAVAEGARRLLQGPRRYLVIAANNAEMRAGSGMLLSVGVATFADGEFDLGEMSPSPDFNLPAGAVALPEGYAELWGWLHPTEDWRNLATTPRFDVTAPLAADMWQAATGETVDGVLVVDPATLEALLAAQGPIDVEGRTLGADDVVQYLLLDQYAGLGIDDPQASRRDQLSAVARAGVDTLESRPWDTAGLVEQLGHVGQGRHVLAWARDPVEQRGWRAAGIDGTLRFDSLMVSLLNVGANKVDQFIEVDARLRITEVADGGHDATISLTIANTAPADLAGYVAGPHPATDLAPGEYQAIVAVNGPGVGGLARFEDLEPQLVAGFDGPTKVSAAGYLRVPRGEQRRVTVVIRLPEALEGLRIEPSARIPPVTWHFGRKTWQDQSPERVEW